MTNHSPEAQQPIPQSYSTEANLSAVKEKRNYLKEWRKRNPDKAYAQHRRWADKNKVQRAAYARDRRKKLKARIAAQRGRRAALKRGNPVINPQAVIQWMEDWHKKELVLAEMWLSRIDHQLLADFYSAFCILTP